MVLDELQHETVLKKQLLEKATSLLNCLESGQPYEWATDTVRLCVWVVLSEFYIMAKLLYLMKVFELSFVNN